MQRRLIKSLVFPRTPQYINFIPHSAISKTKKKYILSQFPYPSGQLHLGHARVYYIGDSLARYYRLHNQQVIYPIGFDSFGLPAQNAAIIHKLNPKQWTMKNIKSMTDQLHYLGVDFNWDCTFATSQPSYYRFTQMIFVKLFQKGLAYRDVGEVNWDPVDKTVLANEQVDKFGRSWRSGALVQKKKLQQWYFSITKYAKQLQYNLSSLDKWLDRVKSMQQGWIGYRQGYFIDFIIYTIQNGKISEKYQKVFLQQKTQLLKSKLCIKMRVQEQVQISNINAYAINPINNQRIKIIPVYDYPIQFQLISEDNSQPTDIKPLEKINFHETKIMRIRDWLISRQRYWGTPIPIIYCPNCGTLPVPQQQLPVNLPQWKGEGNPLLKPQFINCKCHKCGSSAKRQTDTMDTFVDSSWYYLRFLDPNNQKQICNKQISNFMMPVDIYIGGIEHAIMHLLYARFIMLFLSKEEHICEHSQPFNELIVQGLVKGKTIKVKQTGQYLKQNQISRYSGEQLEQTYQKMSKSKFNGVNPTAIVTKYGADSLRMALFFAAPPEHDVDFNEQLLISIQRFLTRIQNVVNQLQKKLNKYENKSRSQLSEQFPQFYYNIKKIIEKLQQSMERRFMHTYVGNMMEFFNQIKKQFEQKGGSGNNIYSIYVTIKDVFIPMISVIAPELVKKIQKKQLFSIQSQMKWIGSSQFTDKTQYLVMKGKKLAGKGKISNNLTDQQIWAKLGTQFKNNKLESIKRNRKNIILIIS